MCVGLICIVLGVTAANADESSVIRATATVVQPMGLIDAQQIGDALAFPVVTEFSSRWFLYCPRNSTTIVQLNGRPLDLDGTQSENVISVLDLSQAAGHSADSLTVTIIYSEN